MWHIRLNRERNGKKIGKKYANQEPGENVISVTILYQASFGLACYEQAGVFFTLLCFEPFIFREVLNNCCANLMIVIIFEEAKKLSLLLSG